MQGYRYLKSFLIISIFSIFLTFVKSIPVFALDKIQYENFYNSFNGTTLIVPDVSIYAGETISFQLPTGVSSPSGLTGSSNVGFGQVGLKFYLNDGSFAGTVLANPQIIKNLKPFHTIEFTFDSKATGNIDLKFSTALNLKPLQEQEQYKNLGVAPTPPPTTPPTQTKPDNSWIPTINGNNGFTGILDGIIDIILDFLKELLKHGKGIMIAGITLGALFISGKWLFIKVRQWINKA